MSVTTTASSAVKAINALREVVNASSDKATAQKSKLATFLATISSTTSVPAAKVTPLVKMLWEGTHYPLTGGTSYQKSQATLLLVACNNFSGTPSNLTVAGAQKILAALFLVSQSHTDTDAEQKGAVRSLISAIGAITVH